MQPDTRMRSEPMLFQQGLEEGGLADEGEVAGESGVVEGETNGGDNLGGAEVATHRIDRDMPDGRGGRSHRISQAGAKRLGEGSDGDVEHLATAIHAVDRIHAVGAEGAAIDRILGELGRLEGVGSATVGAAAFGLLAFRIGHGERVLRVMRGVAPSGL
jgi:hypothetical protein